VVETVSTQGAWSDDGDGGALVWGVFRDPVASVRVQLEGHDPFEPDMYAPPADYPDAHNLFVFEYQGNVEDLRGRVIGFDAAGEVVTTDRIEM